MRPDGCIRHTGLRRLGIKDSKSLFWSLELVVFEVLDVSFLRRSTRRMEKYDARVKKQVNSKLQNINQWLRALDLLNFHPNHNKKHSEAFLFAPTVFVEASFHFVLCRGLNEQEEILLRVVNSVRRSPRTTSGLKHGEQYFDHLTIGSLPASEKQHLLVNVHAFEVRRRKE